MDETGVPLDPKTPKVFCKKGQKMVWYCSLGNKSQITVIGCANAMSQALPPSLYLMPSIRTYCGLKVKCQALYMASVRVAGLTKSFSKGGSSIIS